MIEVKIYFFIAILIGATGIFWSLARPLAPLKLLGICLIYLAASLNFAVFASLPGRDNSGLMMSIATLLLISLQAPLAAVMLWRRWQVNSAEKDLLLGREEIV
jgi:NADH:ubiquinone oxidoreductase subunit K